eukprot:6912337-Prymnesium_polylepis.1
MGANQSAPLAAALEKLAAEVRSSGGNEVQLRALLRSLKAARRGGRRPGQQRAGGRLGAAVGHGREAARHAVDAVSGRGL